MKSVLGNSCTAEDLREVIVIEKELKALLSQLHHFQSYGTPQMELRIMRIDSAIKEALCDVRQGVREFRTVCREEGQGS